MHKYKKGDKVRIVNYPEERGWEYPGDRGKAKNGDILTVTEDGTKELYLNHPLTGTTLVECVQFDIGRGTLHGGMPIEWVEPVEPSEEDEACTCDIMVTGCICGKFQREQTRKGAGG